MEKNVNNSGFSIAKIIEAVVDDGKRAAMERAAARERARQQALSEDDDVKDDDVKPKAAASATTKDEKEKLKTGDVTVDDVVSKLNTIRSGKSFKDEEISNKLKEYFESLSKAEKTALLAFLKGISQVVTGEVPAENIQDPSDSPSNVEMKKGDDQKSIKVKPTVIKKPEKGTKRPTGEDTSGPVPIKPKK